MISREELKGIQERWPRRDVSANEALPYYIGDLWYLLAHIEAQDKLLAESEDMVSQLIGRELDLHALLEQAEEEMRSLIGQFLPTDEQYVGWRKCMRDDAVAALQAIREWREGKE